MAILPAQLARVSNSLRTSMAQQTIARTQHSLLRVQQELATGKRLNVPSDHPGDAAIVQQLHKTLEQREAFATNLRQGITHLSEAELALADLGDLLLEAQRIASANVGSDVTPEQRQAAGQLVQGLYQQALSLVNRQAGGVYLFGGDRSTQPPFVESDGAVRFVGSSTLLGNHVDHGTVLPFMVDGAAALNVLSARIEGAAVGQGLTGLTPLSQLNGGAGIDPSGFVMTNGPQSATVDLSGVTTVEGLLNAINGAGVGVRAAINASGSGIVLMNEMSGWELSISENGGATADELGVLAAAGSVPAAGVFGRLAALRDALLSGNQSAITRSSEGLQLDFDRLARVRGETGARVREMESRLERLTDQNLATAALLSSLEDVDFTEAILRFQTLEASLQATLQTGARLLNLSLLDFLG
jgi:flagellar hook-associated protein 3 FlgL